MIDRESAEKALRPYLADLRACIVTGFTAWQELGRVLPALRAPLTSRTRATFIYDTIIAGVRTRFAEKRSVRMVDRRGFLELIIKRQYVIRFKKLDAKGRSRNILTPAQRRWFESQLRLPEMPLAAERLIAGYVLDELGTEIARVLVTSPAGPLSVDWVFDIEEAPSKVLEIPRIPTVTGVPTVRSVERRTADEADDKDKSDE